MLYNFTRHTVCFEWKGHRFKPNQTGGSYKFAFGLYYIYKVDNDFKEVSQKEKLQTSGYIVTDMNLPLLFCKFVLGLLLSVDEGEDGQYIIRPYDIVKPIFLEWQCHRVPFLKKVTKTGFAVAARQIYVYFSFGETTFQLHPSQAILLKQ